MAKTIKEKDLGFEATLASLERIVIQLESGELPLEQSLELFEQGVGMARSCQTQLEEAERKVEMLLRERGEIKVVPFEVKGETAATENANAQVAKIENPAAAPVADDDDIPF